MAVLVQEVICGDYAFVIHTNNPVTGDPSEIYTEVKLRDLASFYVLVLSKYPIIKNLRLSDCEGFGRNVSWRISRTSNELHHQENKPQVTNREKQETYNICQSTPFI